MTEQENKGWTLHDEVEKRLISFFDNQDGLRFLEDDQGELQRNDSGSLVVTNEYGSFALDDLIDAVLGKDTEAGASSRPQSPPISAAVRDAGVSTPLDFLSIEERKKLNDDLTSMVKKILRPRWR